MKLKMVVKTALILTVSMLFGISASAQQPQQGPDVYEQAEHEAEDRKSTRLNSSHA